MTFAKLVADIINGKHPDRVREGRKADPSEWTEVEQAICEALDRRHIYPPGASGLPKDAPPSPHKRFRTYPPSEPEELETVDMAELEIAP